ncbi:MAG: MarR family transcriptional regulator, partial [Pararhodobacter sp.]|nr:MarR family transcriptional regulator [Pararhodobacter sp.]
SLNPAQRAALDYLARANRFSRSPSHVADYLGTTRGTVSQTLKSLTRKGLVAEQRSDQDRRWISYQLTDAGRDAAAKTSPLLSALDEMPQEERAAIAAAMEGLLRTALRLNGSKPFGLCKTCRHFTAREAGGYCALLQVALCPSEIEQICHEHDAG